jgi:hypothetical protein
MIKPAFEFQGVHLHETLEGGFVINQSEEVLKRQIAEQCLAKSQERSESLIR